MTLLSYVAVNRVADRILLALISSSLHCAISVTFSVPKTFKVKYSLEGDVMTTLALSCFLQCLTCHIYCIHQRRQIVLLH